MFFTFYCNQLSLISAMGFDYSCTFHFGVITGFLRLFTVFKILEN